MTGHPNRSRSNPARNPSPEQIRATREAAGLTQTAAARLVNSTLRAWQGWEAPSGDIGHRRMSYAVWFALHAKLTLPPDQIEEIEKAMKG